MTILPRPFWADLIDRGIAAAVDADRVPSVDGLLARAGLLPWSPYKAEARTYAVKMLDAAKERGDLTPHVRSLAAIALDQHRATAKHKAMATKPRAKGEG
jgi:hypothetical protein